MGDETSPQDIHERNANNLERIADACESIAFFLNALLAGEAESQDEPPPPNSLLTQNGYVELR